MLLALNASYTGMKDNELSKSTDVFDEKTRETQKISTLENDLKQLKGDNYILTSGIVKIMFKLVLPNFSSKNLLFSFFILLSLSSCCVKRKRIRIRQRCIPFIDHQYSYMH